MVYSSNTSKYQQGFSLTEKTKIELNNGEYLTLKAQSGKTFRLEGPYMDSPEKQDMLTVILAYFVASAEACNCAANPTTLSCIAECITSPIIPKADESDSRTTDSVVNGLRNFIRERFFKGAASSDLRLQKSNTDRLKALKNPWLLLAPLDKHFCSRPNEPLTIWRPEVFKDKLVVLPAEPTAGQSASATDLEQKFVVTLHTMPDDKTLPSNTYKAVWMVEKGCYRQAELLLSPADN
ncbi:MAG: hypothetical protein DRR19_16980 [Candidatus Parabeggiatoa sp. nov. 1]|nr:MAG: hypothetical protein DRR19_16980 [Gammaproteobacteria bacterium]